ncbi:MAG: AmmeMemoRadiSam system protein B [Fretibacterium sp.]|nr:AmmeMemoRadiSam system protein B [Fretibacterium sp.]
MKKGILLLTLLFSFKAALLEAAPLIGALSPHHDIAAPMIDALYVRLAELCPNPPRVVLIGPDHYLRARRNIVHCGHDWSTPSGPLRADREGAERLQRTGAALSHDSIFSRDHSITEHIPRVRRFFGDVPVLPLLVRSSASDLQVLRVRRILELLLEDGGIVVLSMDLSHYKPRAQSDAEDEKSLRAIQNFELNRLNSLDIDSPRGARLFLSLMKALDATQTLLMERGNSSDTLSNATRTTGHATMLFSPPNPQP